jgi:hypothetical protein
MSAVEGFRGVRDRIPESIVFDRDSSSLVEMIPPLSGRTTSHRFCPDFEFNACPVEMVGGGGRVDIIPY